MKNTLLTLLLMILWSTTSAARSLDVYWLGSTTAIIADHQTAILFDPYIDRPDLSEILLFKSIKSDPKVIKNWLAKVQGEKIKAVFVSHTHFDHVLDLGEVLRQTKAKSYGSKSASFIARGEGIKKEMVHQIAVDDVIKVGDFKIKVLKGIHPTHLLDFTWASGRIQNTFKQPVSIAKYLMGDVFNFYIEHPVANILFHPSASPSLEKDFLKKTKADLVMLGIANRSSTEDQMNKIVLPIGAKQLIPMHFDSLSASLDEPPLPMGMFDIDEFKKTVQTKFKKINLKTLNYGELFTIKEKSL